ncbi:hypothetical protein Tco_0835076 [Tanacetum coccineum]
MLTPTTYQAPTENSLLEKTGDMRTFMNWYFQKIRKTELTHADLEGQAYEVVKPFYPDVVHLQFQMEECHKMLTNQIDWANPEVDQVRIDISKPLPLSGPPGHVTIQTQFFFNKDLDYLRYGSKGSGQALLISKMKAARYHDFGLELLVPEHMWIDDVCTYDISASYGISHWWFNRQKFYIDRHTAKSSRKVVRIHMRILRVRLVRGIFSILMELESDSIHKTWVGGECLNSKLISNSINMFGSRNDRVEDFQFDIESYQKQLNLTKPGWDATGFEFKHDYTIIDLPRVIVFLVSKNEQKIMRFNEIYKFSDGTLTNIMEALDYRVKEYKVQVKMAMEIPYSSRVYFITACSYSTDTSNDLMKAQKGMSMPVQMSPAQDGKRPKVDDQRLDLADDLKEAQDHISSIITSHKTKIAFGVQP